MVKESMGYNLSVNYDHVAGLKVTLDEPDEEALRSFLLAFRRFISPGDNVFVPHL